MAHPFIGGSPHRKNKPVGSILIFVSPARRPPTRTRILDAADRLFGEHGIRAVGVDAIVAAADTAKTTLYAHFGSKDGLVVAYLQRRAAERQVRLERALALHRGSPVERVLHLYDLLAVEVGEPGYRGSPFANASRRARRRAPRGGRRARALAVAPRRLHRPRHRGRRTRSPGLGGAAPAALRGRAAGWRRRRPDGQDRRRRLADRAHCSTRTHPARHLETPPRRAAGGAAARGVPQQRPPARRRRPAGRRPRRAVDRGDGWPTPPARACRARRAARDGRRAAELLVVREGLRELAAVNCGDQADPHRVAQAVAQLERTPLLVELAPGAEPRLTPVEPVAEPTPPPPAGADPTTAADRTAPTPPPPRPTAPTPPPPRPTAPTMPPPRPPGS